MRAAIGKHGLRKEPIRFQNSLLCRHVALGSNFKISVTVFLPYRSPTWQITYVPRYVLCNLKTDQLFPILQI